MCMPNFDEIPHSTVEIKLLPVSENRRPPYWKSISGFDFNSCIVIDMSFCICLPNFVVIGRSVVELLHHIEFSRRQPQSRKSTSGMRFIDSICLSSRKSIYMQNLDEISQSPAEIILLPVSENGRPPYWNSISGFNGEIHFRIPICHFTSACQIS